jgi:transitional endoplasmic reticulum ATPase
MDESERAMADAAVLDKGTVRLQVAAARQEESGRGVARMPRSAFQALGITEGDPVEVEGKRVTAAVALPAYDEDEALEVVRLDGLLRANADTSSGEHVTIRRAEARPATRVAGRDWARQIVTCSPDEVSALARWSPSSRTTSSD